MTYTAIAIFETSRSECTTDTEADARRWVEAELNAHEDAFGAGQVMCNDPMGRVVASYTRAEGWIVNG